MTNASLQDLTPLSPRALKTSSPQAPLDCIRALAVAALVLTLSGCASGRFGPDPDTEAPKGPRTLKKLTVAERHEVMERANVWRSLNTSSLNLIEGPVLPRALRIPAAVECTF